MNSDNIFERPLGSLSREELELAVRATCFASEIGRFLDALTDKNKPQPKDNLLYDFLRKFREEFGEVGFEAAVCVIQVRLRRHS